MRVTAGSAGGRKLLTLEGDHVRPTGDKVKQAIFSALQFEVAGRTVLDLFAGSGQMGIEALSRGAKSCVFVDHAQESLGVTEKNLETTGFSQASSLVCSAYEQYLAGAPKKALFDLVFLDPPYGKGLAQNALELLTAQGLLSRRAILVMETGAEEQAPQSCGGMVLAKEKRYGHTMIRIYRREG